MSSMLPTACSSSRLPSGNAPKSGCIHCCQIGDDPAAQKAPPETVRRFAARDENLVLVMAIAEPRSNVRKSPNAKRAVGEGSGPAVRCATRLRYVPFGVIAGSWDPAYFLL